METGHWLLRTGLFRCVCFFSYADFQGRDPVGVAVSTLGALLEHSLIDADAATAHTPTLLILDNLESLGERLPELLDAAARWSKAGDSRVLLTSRLPDLGHPDYPPTGSFQHQSLALGGLAPQDALAWFAELMRLPLPPQPDFGLPQRNALLELSLERLPDEARRWLPRLGVFQGGGQGNRTMRKS